MKTQERQRRRLFWVVVTLLLICLGGRLYHKYLNQNSASLLRSVAKNTAKPFTYQARASKAVAERVAGQDFPPGYYDLSVTGGRVNGLASGQRLENQFYNPAEHLSFQGSGRVQFKPARFSPLVFTAGQCILTNTYGNYLAGAEIASGDYTITWRRNQNSSTKFALLVQVVSKNKTTSADGPSWGTQLLPGQTAHFKLKPHDLLAIVPPVENRAIAQLELMINRD